MVSLFRLIRRVLWGLLFLALLQLTFGLLFVLWPPRGGEGPIGEPSLNIGLLNVQWACVWIVVLGSALFAQWAWTLPAGARRDRWVRRWLAILLALAVLQLIYGLVTLRRPWGGGRGTLGETSSAVGRLNVVFAIVWIELLVLTIVGHWLWTWWRRSRVARR